VRKNPIHRNAKIALSWALLASVFFFESQAVAQTYQTTVPTDILAQYRAARILWTTNIWVYANALFGILAVIEFAWSAAVMLLEKTDLQGWTQRLCGNSCGSAPFMRCC
jgi:hypothetical protein